MPKRTIWNDNIYSKNYKLEFEETGEKDDEIPESVDLIKKPSDKNNPEPDWVFKITDKDYVDNEIATVNNRINWLEITMFNELMNMRLTIEALRSSVYNEIGRLWDSVNFHDIIIMEYLNTRMTKIPVKIPIPDDYIMYFEKYGLYGTCASFWFTYFNPDTREEVRVVFNTNWSTSSASNIVAGTIRQNTVIAPNETLPSEVISFQGGVLMTDDILSEFVNVNIILPQQVFQHMVYDVDGTWLHMNLEMYTDWLVRWNPEI